MLLGYVCKSVRASDGTRGPTAHRPGLGPSGSPTPREDVYWSPPPQWARETSPPPPPPPPGPVSSQKAGSLERRVSVTSVSRPRSVCLSSQPALGVGPRQIPTREGSLVPAWGWCRGGCCCRWPVSSSLRGSWRGGQIFNVLYRVFLCNHPHFYLMTDLSWLLFLNSALVENKGNGPWPAWGVVCDA